MKNEVLKDYLKNGKVDIDKIIDNFYGYVYIIVKNGVNITITDEDIEEIISDVFIAIWKNSSNLLKTTEVKPYLTGIAKNMIRNKYRNIELNFSILDYEENLVDTCNIEKITEENEQNKDNLKVDLQINKIESIGTTKFDADIEIISEEKLPDEFKFMKNIKIPQEFKTTDMYKIYVRSNKDIKKYDLLHDCVFSYQKDDENSIRVALSTVAEPIRDYHLGDNDKISEIGNTELEISQYEKMYMATFKMKNMYFDIETNGITEHELVELIKFIINEKE